MSIPAAVLVQMATLGLDREQAEAVASMLAAVEEATRSEGDAGKEKARARWRRWRENHPRTNDEQRLQTLANDSQRLVRGGARVEDKSQTTEIEPQLENKKREPALASVEFEDWYSGYPHKVERGAAERAFVKARSIASLAELKAGVQRYIAAKPIDRHWQNPATWLNGKGWLDQPGVVVPMARGSPAIRPVDDLINSLVSQMDEADANPAAKIEGHPAAPLRLSSRQW